SYLMASSSGNRVTIPSMNMLIDQQDDNHTTVSSHFKTSIDAWYTGDLERGRAACEAILTNRDIPDRIRKQTLRNITYYAQSLTELAPGVRFQRLPGFAETGWSWFNPTIAVDTQGVHILVRSSNYT